MKFTSTPIEEHAEVPVADDGQWEHIVEHWQQQETRWPQTNELQASKSYVVSVVMNREEVSEAKQQEILGLVRAQGDDIVGQEMVRLKRPDPKALFRSGAAKDIAARAKACGANLFIVDALLSPSQTRNLEDVTGFPVRDREAVILNVFQRQVKTRKARIQVEIAHLEYLRPRIRGLGLQMDQQAGGVVGSRGPGETVSELLARQLDGRLAVLRKAFAKIVNASQVQRKRRGQCKKVALVGYTNAGKSSLMNALTDAGVSAADRPFETLDSTSRCLTRHGGDVLLSDTVGFIRDLPKRLLASFASTLAEIREASLLGMVVDCADEELELHMRTTEDMLVQLGAETIPRFYIFNKIDKRSVPLSPQRMAQLSLGYPHTALSSTDEDAVAALKKQLLHTVRTAVEQRDVFVPYNATDAIARIYAKCVVLHCKPRATGILFTLNVHAQTWTKLQRDLDAKKGNHNA